MIPLLLLAGAGIAYWAWSTRDGQAMRIGDVAAAIAALIGLKLIRTEVPLALIALFGAGWWLWFRQGGRMRGDRNGVMSHAEARDLLAVPIDATPDEIRAAHRRLVARVHPDVGGSADLTRRINMARDTLLRHRG
jgi:DnaJ homolog subfamily C member 19